MIPGHIIQHIIFTFLVNFQHTDIVYDGLSIM